MRPAAVVAGVALAFAVTAALLLRGPGDASHWIADGAGYRFGAKILALGRATREAIDGDALVDVPCDIWVPAARPDVLREDNVERLAARLVVQGANDPRVHRRAARTGRASRGCRR